MIPNCKTDINCLVTRLRGEGVSLWAENGKLHYRAPQGMLAGSDLQFLKNYKEDVLRLLQSEAKPATAQLHPESRYEPFPLTDVQSAYLLGRSQVFGYGGVACHIYLELTYPELESGRVESVWNKLVLRHDMLRAVINSNGYQQVMEKVPRLEVPYTDASGWETGNVTAKLEEIREEMGHRIYNTESWPLFGVAVTKTPDRTVLHFSIEFLIADWASIWLLLSEFEALYNEPERKLPDIKLSFRDYLIAERSLRESAVFAKDKDYWLRRIEALPPAPDLPMARQQTDSGKIRFSRRFLKLDAQTWNDFKQKAQQRGLTPTTAVMTAYAAVIERWSRNKKFCLNLTVLNRLPLHPQVNAVVGDFTSVSLLAVDWYAANSFTAQAKLMNKQLFDDLDHRLFSGVEVLREISRRQGREAALMPFVFTSAIGLVEPTEGNRLQGQVEGQGISQTPQVFIDCQAMDSSAGLQVNWDIREGIFPEGMTDDMFAAFESLLRLLAERPHAWEAGESVALPAWQLNERQRVNDTRMPLPDGLLHSGILAQAAATPDRPAVLDSEGQVTYGELMLRASAVAKKLQETGCRQQDRVAIIMNKSAHQVTAVLGALSAGAVYVPVDTTQPALRRAAMLQKTGVRHILTCSTSKIEWPESITVIEVDKLTPHRENTLKAAGDPDMPAYIIHTSGSTGVPKGVVITHRAAANTVADINSRFQVGREDRVLGLALLSFDLSVYDIFGILSVGGTLIYPCTERLTDPSHWASLIAEHKATVWNSVPALMQMLVAYLNSEQKIDLPTLRLALLSGDWIPLTLPDMLLKRVPSVQVVSLGGATEASIWSNYHIYQGLQPNWNSIPYGRPLANQGFRILDERLRDCPVWVTGRLYITGDGLAKGYFGDQDSTAARFFPHPIDGQRLYHTGDMGCYMPGGEIEFLGREDNQVKIKGHRIELGEIEAALQKHPAVAAAAVVVDHSGDNKQLLGIVEACAQQGCMPADAAALAEFLSQRLPNYMIPADIRIVAALPLTDNGKIDRRELAKWKVQSLKELSVQQAAAKTADPLEEELLRIWAAALGMPVIGRLQNFYEHGADSLIMAQVAGKLRELFSREPLKLEIPFDALLRQMLNYPTVAALAEFVHSQHKTGNAVRNDPVSQQRKNASNAVLTSYGGGTGALRVIFHAGLGTMNCFRQLLTHLQEQNSGPVTGITVADTELYCSVHHAGLIEQLADDYAGRLIETGHKEMQLIGYSLGGLIAVEAARRLLEKGIHLLDLVLIDSPPILYDINDNLVIESLFIQNLHIPLEKTGFGSVTQDEFVRGLRHLFEINDHSIPAGASLTIGGNEELDKVGDLFRGLSALSPRERFTAYVEAMANVNGDNMPVEMAEGMFRVFRQSLKSAHFTPQPYMGNIRFLLADEPFALMPWTNETTLGFWQDVCLGEFSVQKIAGNHFTCIATESNARELAKVLGMVF